MKTDNELIAEFMGFKRNGNHYHKSGEEIYQYFGDGYGNVFPDEFAFDVRWNWLMPVVEKIRKIVEDNHSKSTGPENKDMELFDEIVDHGLAWVDINATYKAVVEFIKWYQSQPEAI